nr:uncharacterized protein LOC129154747 [Nothobranchius furzeri]
MCPTPALVGDAGHGFCTGASRAAPPSALAEVVQRLPPGSPVTPTGRAGGHEQLCGSFASLGRCRLPVSRCPAWRGPRQTGGGHDGCVTPGVGVHWQCRSVQGLWSPRQARLHINVLELKTVYLALRRFLPFLRDKHVLVWTDSTSAVFHINHQEGSRSLRSLREAQTLLTWAYPCLASIRALHLPGWRNSVADCLSRRGLPSGEWRLHPQVVQRVWHQFGEAQVDLFASRSSKHCPLWFSLAEADAPLGMDALANVWPLVRLYAFPPFPLILPTLHWVRDSSHEVLLVARPAHEGLVSIASQSVERGAVAVAGEAGPPVSDGGEDLASVPRSSSAHGLAIEGCRQPPVGLEPSIQQVLDSARAPSTRASYARCWQRFSAWCSFRDVDPGSCSLHEVLRYLRHRFDKGRTASTLKVHLAAISANHLLVDGRSVGAHYSVTQFLRGVRRLRPPLCRPAPARDLPLVLQALCGPPFEPMTTAPLEVVSVKTAFLLAVTTAKRVSELHALDISPAYLRWKADGSGVTLWPNVAFLPKVLPSGYVNAAIELGAYFPPPFHSEGQRRANLLCPVRALQLYIVATNTVQLFVCHGGVNRGRALSKQRLSHWVVDAIAMAYAAVGAVAPPGIVCHSTRSVTTSWAAMKGVPLVRRYIYSVYCHWQSSRNSQNHSYTVTSVTFQRLPRAALPFVVGLKTTDLYTLYIWVVLCLTVFVSLCNPS